MLKVLSTAQIARFLSRIAPPNESGCRDWLGGISSQGYGAFWIDGKNHGAHRVALWVAGVETPPGMHVDHLCRNRKCCAADHLEVVTPRENNLRGDTVGRANAAKTHCRNGHELISGNLDSYALKNGRRACATCMRQRCRAWHHKNREKRLQKMREYKAKQKQEARHAV